MASVLPRGVRAVAVDDRQQQVTAALARAQARAHRALALAARAGQAAARAEQRSHQCPAFLTETWTRIARIQRDSQRRQLAAARLNKAYAARLRRSMDLSAGSRAASFLAAAAEVSSVDKVVLSLSGRGQSDALVAASDAVARSAHELERAYGEGPATDAMERHAPVRASGELAKLWPLYGPAVSLLGIHAVSAAPLCLRDRCLGSVTTLDPDPQDRRRGLSADQLADALARTLLEGDIPADGDGLARMALFDDDQAQVHQAAGMVAAESGLDIPDALDLIRARAFADNQPVRTVAARIASRQLRLTIPP